jgi:hypothetical protein
MSDDCDITITETTEVTGELLCVWPRLVQLTDDLWVNVDKVAAIERRMTTGTRVVWSTGAGVFVDRPTDEIVALLMDDERP